jgi:hypothetical protein
METVRITGRGMTERKAIAQAKAWLEMRGFTLVDQPPPTAQVERDDAGRPVAWHVSIAVQEPKG